MSIERILLIDEVDEDNTVVVMSQSSLILRSLPVPPEKMKIDQQIARTCLIIKYQQQTEVEFVHPVSPGWSVNFLPAV